MANKKIFIAGTNNKPDVKRSPFDWRFVNNVTAKFGKVNCVLMKYLPPNSNMTIKPRFAFDLSPLVYPIQTNVRCHLEFYKVPLRILWKDAEDYFSSVGSDGLPLNGGGTPFVVPYIKRPTGWNALGSFAEQMGISNVRYVDKESVVVLKGSRSLYDSSHPHPVSLFDTGMVGRDCFFISLSAGLAINSSQIVSQSIGSFRIRCLSNFTTSSNTHKVINLRLAYFDNGVVKYTNEALVLNYVNNISLVTTSDSVYSWYINLSPSSNVDGNSCYSLYLHINIPIDSDFAKKQASLSSSGFNTTVVVSPSTSSFEYDFLFPSVVINSKPSITEALSVEPKSFDADTGNITSSQITTVVSSSLGVCDSLEACVVSVGTEVDTKFDSIEGADPVEPVCALPFRALEFIHNYFKRNPRVDPFFKDGVPAYNKFLTNDGSGADETTPVESWNALYEIDMFTSCVKEPQFGNAPLVGVTVNDTSDTGILNFEDTTTHDAYSVEVNIGEDGTVLPLSVLSETADRPNIHKLREIIDFGISINDLRNVGTFQRMLERLQKTDYRFQNVMYQFFGTNPPIGDHYPQYLGGVTRDIMVDKITNVAKSESAELGEFAGDGYFRYPRQNEKQAKIRLYTTEPTYLVGIMYFSVTPTYSQHLPKHFLYKDPLDWYINPDFAYVGPQPVYKKQIAPNQISAEHLNDVFGYNRPYVELFSNVDEVHGDFKTTRANFLLQRFFADAPELNKSFIEINSEDLLNIFSVQLDTDKVYGQILFDMYGSLPAPRSYAPRSI